ncbi:lantibiotic dehydratase [Altericista sp. CCNU0014]|uniref:lantibiotic dehydratase n=1 Tax=Altericista sp. CCNU0014 TaxID=3082949 RepID=UPI003850A13D
MGNSVQDYDLAPVGILRAAAWPLESLREFGDPALAELARQDLSDPQAWERYLNLYERVFQRERAALWRQTADNPRFMKALALSAALVARRTTSLQSRRHLCSKAIRRLDRTLYRYLARAVGRTTPQGLWAGVTAVTRGERTQVRPQPAQYVFTPDLRPFQAILKTIGRRSPYWERTVWHVNPTAARQPDGTWQWWARSAAGQVDRRALSPTGAEAFLEALTQLTQGTFAELTSALSQQLGSTEAVAITTALDQLVTGGLLLGGLDLPARFTTPWEVLHAAESALVEPDRTAWSRTTRALQDQCDALATNLENWPYEIVLEALDAAARQIADLGTTLGIEALQLPEPVLHCDYGLPFQVEIGPDEAQSLRETLAAYEREWLLGWSPATAFRQNRHRSQQQLYRDGLDIADIQMPVPAPLLATWDSLTQTHAAIVPALAAWEKILNLPEEKVTLPAVEVARSLPLAPWGCLYTQLHRDWHQTVQGTSDYATQAFARVSTLVDPQGQLTQWCNAQLLDFRTRYDLLMGDLQSPLEANPNVLARPALDTQPISLWCLDANTLSLKGAFLKRDPSTQLPLLYVPAVPQAIAVFGFSSAHVAGGDPIAASLLETGFQANPGAIFQATALPVPCEVSHPRFSPRVLLSNEAGIRNRRTVLIGAEFADLLQAAPDRRFVLWQQIASAYGWPVLLNVAAAAEAPLPIHRDSPLALSALFKGLNIKTPYLIVEAVDRFPWLVDRHGAGYQAELAQPFRRKEHGWTPRSGEVSLTLHADPEPMSCPN